MATALVSLEEALQRLVGKPLVSVVFVHDYLQLVWDEAGLTINNPVTIEGPGYVLTSTDDLFPRRLTALIDKETSRIEVARGKFVRLHFACDWMVSISLLAKDYAGPEALVFHTQGADSIWVA